MAKTNTSIARVIATCVKQIATALEVLGKSEHVMTTRERKRLVKPRPQLRQIAVSIAQLAPEFGVHLAGDISTATMAARIADADRFRPLLSIVEDLHVLLGDIVLRAESDAWDAAMANYTALRHVAERRGALEGKLAPVIATLANGQRTSAQPSGGDAASPEPMPAPAVHSSAAV